MWIILYFYYIALLCTFLNWSLFPRCQVTISISYFDMSFDSAHFLGENSPLVSGNMTSTNPGLHWLEYGENQSVTRLLPQFSHCVIIYSLYTHCIITYSYTEFGYKAAGIHLAPPHHLFQTLMHIGLGTSVV